MQDHDQDRLDSWKQIAAYLGKSERTMRRWQEVEGLPVHRHVHQQRGSVWAFKKEIDEWLASRRENPSPLLEEPEGLEADPPTETGPEPMPPPSKRTWRLVAGLAAACLLGAAGLVWIRDRPSVLPEPEPLTALPGSAYGVTFSPDGRKVAFHWSSTLIATSGIYSKEIGSEKVAAVATKGDTPDYLYSPAWSPDGKTIAYLRRVFPQRSAFPLHAADTETWLCLVNADGGPERRFRRLATRVLYYGNHAHLAWSRDGKRIIAPMADGGLRGIYWIPLDGGKPVRLTPPEEAAPYAPVLSPGDRGFLYMTQQGPRQAAVESLLRLDLDTLGQPRGKPRLLSQTRSLTSGVAWMPSGDEILICRADNALFGAFNSRLHRMRAEPRQPTVPLGFGHCTGVAALAREDGSALVAYGSGESMRSRLWRAPLDALDRPVPFAPSSRFDGLPSHSPDGSSVAFVSNRSGKPEIWVATRDGAGVRKLAETSEASSTPKWSPDGTRLVFATSRPGVGPRLHVTSVAAGVPSELPFRNAFEPSWSSSGDAIHYWAGQQLWQARIDGSGARSIGEFPIHWLNSGALRTADEKTIFYVGHAKPYGLVRSSTEVEKEELIADGLASPFLAASRRSVYFITGNDYALHAVPLTGGVPRHIGGLKLEPRGQLALGLSVSPDDREIIVALPAEQRTDLLLVRGLR